MKIKLSLLIVLSLLLSILPQSVFANGEGVEVVFSENFEGDLSRWECEYIQKGIVLAKSDDEYIGNYVIVARVWEQLGVISENSIMKSPYIEIEPDVVYTFAADVYGDGTPIAYLNFYNENDTLVDQIKMSRGTSEKDAWSCIFKEFRTNEDACKMQIVLTHPSVTGSTSTYGKFDNVMVCKGRVTFLADIEKRINYSPHATDNSTTVMPENVVFSETFEKRIEEWTDLNKKSDDFVKLSAEDSSTGIKSLFIEDKLMETPVGTESKQFSVTPGAEYTVSVDAVTKLKSGVTVELRFFSSENKLVGKNSVSSSALVWTEHTFTEIAPDDAATALVRVISDDYIGENYVDNIMVIQSKPAPEKSAEKLKYDEVLNNSLQFFIGSPNAFVNGEKTLIDKTNDKVVAQIVDSRTLVPVRFIAENYGADVSWDDATKTVTLKISEKTVTIVLNEKQIHIDGRIVEIDVPAQSVEGRTMLPLRAFVTEVMGKNVFWDNRGLIVITDELVLDADADVETINRLVEAFK